jgi:putative SOS response-associated peptidase YedK
MCNIYRVSTKKGTSQGVRGKIAAAVGKLSAAQVRISDPGVVVLADERVEIMRWGFARHFNPAINNARSDKLESGMWAEAFRARRCVIPVSAFYEWGPGAGVRKQAYEFHDPEDDYLWISGLWEPGEGDLGFYYSMVTTEASPLMAPIHARMPAVLRAEEVPAFLDLSNPWEFRPFAGPLAVAPCESPLKRKSPPRDDPQGELWDR